MVIILTHENCDFDGLASLVAASKIYPGSTIILPETLQPNVRYFVNLYRDLLPVTDPKDLDQEIETVVVVDTNRRERLGRWSCYLDQAAKIIVYDHHHGDEDIKSSFSVTEPVGATTTILLEKILNNDITLTEFETSLFALGIYEDTGCLTYDITTPKDARALAELWSLGITAKLIKEYLRSSLNDDQKVLLEMLLRNSELYEINQRRILISATVLDQYVFGAAVLIQLLDEIEDAGLTIIIIQMSDSINLAARSRDDDLNLLELLAPFDVKGYPSAVSAHFKGADIDDVKKQLLEFLKYYLPPAASAEDVASNPVFVINSDMPVAEADELLAEHNYTGCPVIENGNLVGIISRRDLRKGLRSDLGHAPVKGFMSRQIITASPNDSLRELRRLMVTNNIGRVPIINEDGSLAGIVTRSDILRHLDNLDKKGRFLPAKNNYSFKKVDLHGNLPDQSLPEIKNLADLIKSRLPSRLQKLLMQISQLADRKNIRAYLVGGMIRDLLLFAPLEEDLDFVIIGDAVEFTQSLQKLLGGSIRHFEQFGTASLDLADGLRLDFVTARKEIYNTPAALPQVERSDLKNDLCRRDFTINTMACALSVENFGELYDYYNGQGDLKNKVIRTLYQLSFVDDPLRILRAIRFEQRYDFIIEPDTLDSIYSAIERKVISKVSRQRLNQELKYIYEEPSPLKILKRFNQLGLIEQIYPMVRPESSTWRLLTAVEEIINWAGERKWKIKPDIELVYISGLTFGLESADQSAIIRKLSFSKERTAIIVSTCSEAPLVLKKLDHEDLKPSMVVNCLENLAVETILLVYAMTDNKTVRDHLKLFMEKLRHVKPQLSGADLKNIGLKPGPRYRKIIKSLRKAVLDGEVRTPQEELDYVTRYLEEENKEEI